MVVGQLAVESAVTEADVATVVVEVVADWGAVATELVVATWFLESASRHCHRTLRPATYAAGS